MGWAEIARTAVGLTLGRGGIATIVAVTVGPVVAGGDVAEGTAVARIAGVAGCRTGVTVDMTAVELPGTWRTTTVADGSTICSAG